MHQWPDCRPKPDCSQGSPYHSTSIKLPKETHRSQTTSGNCAIPPGTNCGGMRTQSAKTVVPTSRLINSVLQLNFPPDTDQTLQLYLANPWCQLKKWLACDFYMLGWALDLLNRAGNKQNFKKKEDVKNCCFTLLSIFLLSEKTLWVTSFRFNHLIINLQLTIPNTSKL